LEILSLFEEAKHVQSTELRIAPSVLAPPLPPIFMPMHFATVQCPFCNTQLGEIAQFCHRCGIRRESILHEYSPIRQTLSQRLGSAGMFAFVIAILLSALPIIFAGFILAVHYFA
jgi:hypothetical protein